jgi:hypothetical protein
MSAVTYDVMWRKILKILPVTNAMQATKEIQWTHLNNGVWQDPQKVLKYQLQRIRDWVKRFVYSNHQNTTLTNLYFSLAYSRAQIT